MSSNQIAAYKITFFVPSTHVEIVKSAMFDAGAGKIGNYEACCWQILGEGQFRALEGSSPYLGRQGLVERVPEFRVEMVCSRDAVPGAIQAMKGAHPYETPAYDVVAIEPF